MTTVHLTHGINVRDSGHGTIGKLSPYFQTEGMTPLLFSYGWVGLMGVWFLNPRIVKQLIPRVNAGDVGIGHSNGCVLLLMASIYGAPFGKLIFINPALTSNAPHAPGCVKSIHVYCNDGDLAVKVAALLRMLAPWAPIGDPLWGDMGARGYQPGHYLTSNYVPSSRISKTIHSLNAGCARAPLLLLVLQAIIGMPMVVLYWLVAAPIEVMLTLWFNNLVAKDKGMSLSTARVEDRRFLVVGLAFPLAVWSVCGLLWRLTS